MAIFRSSSKKKEGRDNDHHHEQKMGGGDGKFRTLEAVKELQPFEEAATHNQGRRQLYLSQESGDLKDIFGHKIDTPDTLNPTRNRNERPLDTIRGFEYAISGDLSYQSQLESQQLGWDFHRDFSHQNYQSNGTGAAPRDYNSNQARFAYNTAPNTYQPVQPGPEADDGKKKKKKKGLFGRSK
ncbi:hypothetical protein PUMCH_002972 [Australozyma saopauloensis]|uniref:Uncharacterized protein n=1 Tax=Australozyma saopauloensis TaxID=291208 RepID=A0AAX4HAR0_9ASCO|nr:hypothetical protein PUMCH_002972 [[Candida] saopauloensis]